MSLTRFKQLIPHAWLQAYHLCLAHVAAVWYGHPSREMIVIGVTGTKGKSSTTNFIAQLLESAGHTVGYTSTAGFKLGPKLIENRAKMTMLGRFATQKMLRQMVKAGCTHAIVETSSQGLTQHRHVGIDYDIALFTNLTPEHIEAHGGFEAYKQAKGILFQSLKTAFRKTLNGKSVSKTIITNADDDHSSYFASFQADHHLSYAINHDATCHATIQSETAQGTEFLLENLLFKLPLIGRFQFINVLAAMTVCHALDVPLHLLQSGVAQIKPVPGRLEPINEGQPFTVLVDYAYEPASFKACYNAIRLLPHKRLIQIIGSAGGGRDVARRETLGKLAGVEADLVIVTNEDPYDEDPQTIIDDVFAGVVKTGKQENQTVWRILDRREAINKACTLAQPSDLVLITGKGSEPVMAVANGQKIPWDDRQVVRETLASFPRMRESKDVS